MFLYSLGFMAAQQRRLSASLVILKRGCYVRSTDVFVLLDKLFDEEKAKKNKKKTKANFRPVSRSNAGHCGLASTTENQYILIPHQRETF